MATVKMDVELLKRGKSLNGYAWTEKALREVAEKSEGIVVWDRRRCSEPWVSHDRSSCGCVRVGSIESAKIEDGTVVARVVLSPGAAIEDDQGIGLNAVAELGPIPPRGELHEIGEGPMRFVNEVREVESYDLTDKPASGGRFVGPTGD